MTKHEECKLLANKILETPSKDPDDDESMLARQFLRLDEALDRAHKALAERDDGTLDLVNANRDSILRKHEEAVRLIKDALTGTEYNFAYIADVIKALWSFHPMHGESWSGWPKKE